MICILSPAKKMREDTDTLPPRDLPRFLNRTEQLLEALRAMSPVWEDGRPNLTAASNLHG